jgi:hypothetical protein
MTRIGRHRWSHPRSEKCAPALVLLPKLEPIPPWRTASCSSTRACVEPILLQNHRGQRAVEGALSSVMFFFNLGFTLWDLDKKTWESLRYRLRSRCESRRVFPFARTNCGCTKLRHVHAIGVRRWSDAGAASLRWSDARIRARQTKRRTFHVVRRNETRSGRMIACSEVATRHPHGRSMWKRDVSRRVGDAGASTTTSPFRWSGQFVVRIVRDFGALEPQAKAPRTIALSGIYWAS